MLTELLPLILVMLAMALAPFAVMMLTCYAKIVIVLGLLRQALGLQQVPPNMVLNGIALVLTMYVMAPVWTAAGKNLQASGQGLVGLKDVKEIGNAIQAVSEPLRGFLLKHSDARERRFFVRTASRLWPAEQARDLREDDFLVVIPAFTVSELTEAFRVGFILFLAFLIVDLIVANVVLAMGMTMVSPTLISVPFKLLLFVLLDGWSRLMQGMVLSYQ